MAFKIILTKDGEKSIRNCVGYILYNFKDKFAAKNLYDDILITIESLKNNAKAHPICEDADLISRGLRKIHLRKHAYKIFYRVEGNEVLIDILLHDKQDYENILK